MYKHNGFLTEVITLDFIETYGHFLKKAVPNHPDLALKMIQLGLFYEENRLRQFPDQKVPKAYQKLNQLAVHSIASALKEPEHSAWVNIFAPVELLQCFQIHPLSLECFSSFMAGFRSEDLMIDYAEKNGIAETLCSYHKAFIGANEAGLLPKPLCGITTSMICDGNINTFRYLSQSRDFPLFTLDIPYEYSKDAENYMTSQLRELIQFLEDLTHQKMDMTSLRKTLERENASKAYYKTFLKKQTNKYYPSNMALQLFMLFASHLSIGTEETLAFYKLLSEDIENYPTTHALKVFWVHLMPYRHQILGDYFNFNPNYQIQTYDLNLDYMEPLDLDHPLEALSKKLILNLFNGSYDRKVQFISKLAQELQVDAAIHFCHWGCKQSAGAVGLLKQELTKAHIPTLILDGDALDHRNSHDGQIKTRLEAFLEMVEKQKVGETSDRVCM